MKHFLIVAMVLIMIPVATAADVEVNSSITLDDNYTAVSNSATAVGYVRVTIVEPPEPPPITGLFLTQFDFAEFSEELSSFLSSFFSLF